MSLGRRFRLMQTLRKSPAVFRRRLRGDSAQTLSHGDPLFKVHYLGTEKIFSLGVEQAEAAVSRLLERGSAAAGQTTEAPVRGGKLGKEHALVVRPRYLEVKELSTGRQLTKTYLRDIAYCAADSTRPNVFLYICKQPSQQLQCRVFWCSRPDRAKDINACLARSFQRALIDWQEGEANHEQGAGPKEEGLPIGDKGKAKCSTLPADLGKGRWRRRSLTARSPLRELMRRASISD